MAMRASEMPGATGGERGGFHGADGVEGVHDAPDGAEQPDERGRVRGGRQEGQGAREAGHFHVHALPERAAHVVDHDVFEFPASFERLNSVTPLVGDGIQRGSRDRRPRDCTASRRSRAWLKRSMPSAAF